MEFYNKLYDSAVSAMMATKTDVCKMQACTDLPYLALFISNDPRLMASLPPEARNSVDDTGHVIVGLPIIGPDPYDVECLKRMLPPFDMTGMVVACEGYSKPTASLQDYRRGDMQKEYESTPFTDVKPGLCIVAVEISTMKVGMSMVTYRYDDRGLPVFDLIDGKPAPVNLHQGGALSGGRAVDNILVAAREYASRKKEAK